MIRNCAPQMFSVCQELCTECLFAYCYNKVYFCDDKSTLHTQHHHGRDFYICLHASVHVPMYFHVEAEGGYEALMRGRCFASQVKGTCSETTNFRQKWLSCFICI